MGRTRSGKVKKATRRLPVWNGNLPENLPSKRITARSRGLLSRAAVGRVEKSEVASHLLPTRLKTNPSLFEGQGVFNRGKAREKIVHLSNFDPEKHQRCELNVEEVLELHRGVPTGGVTNLMGPLLSPSKKVAFDFESGKLVQEQRSPKTKMDSEELANKMRLKMRWTCISCSKSIFSKATVADHLKQAEITFGSNRRMQFKPASCKVVAERVFSEEDILRKIETMKVEIH